MRAVLGLRVVARGRVGLEPAKEAHRVVLSRERLDQVPSIIIPHVRERVLAPARVARVDYRDDGASRRLMARRRRARRVGLRGAPSAASRARVRQRAAAARCRPVRAGRAGGIDPRVVARAGADVSAGSQRHAERPVGAGFRRGAAADRRARLQRHADLPVRAAGHPAPSARAARRRARIRRSGDDDGEQQRRRARPASPRAPSHRCCLARQPALTCCPNHSSPRDVRR